MGYEEDLSGKATLASEDVRFAKTVNRVQRILISELNKIAMVHLYAQGYKDASLVDFNLELTNPSVIFEKEKIAASYYQKINNLFGPITYKLHTTKNISDRKSIIEDLRNKINIELIFISENNYLIGKN